MNCGEKRSNECRDFDVLLPEVLAIGHHHLDGVEIEISNRRALTRIMRLSKSGVSVSLPQPQIVQKPCVTILDPHGQTETFSGDSEA